MVCEHDGCKRERVEKPALERFCRTHRARLLRKMLKDGYLTPRPRTRWSENAERDSGRLFYGQGEDIEVRILAIF